MTELAVTMEQNDHQVRCSNKYAFLVYVSRPVVECSSTIWPPSATHIVRSVRTERILFCVWIELHVQYRLYDIDVAYLLFKRSFTNATFWAQTHAAFRAS